MTTTRQIFSMLKAFVFLSVVLAAFALSAWIYVPALWDVLLHSGEGGKVAIATARVVGCDLHPGRYSFLMNTLSYSFTHSGENYIGETNTLLCSQKTIRIYYYAGQPAHNGSVWGLIWGTVFVVFSLWLSVTGMRDFVAKLHSR